jgi:hypothetical protein
MESLYEIVKAVGSVSGILAGIFLLWDRCIKHFPVAIIVARPLTEGSAHIVPFIYLRNVSDRPLLVSWKDGDRNGLRIAKDQTAEGVVQTLFDGETTIALGPQAEAYLPLFWPREKEAIEPENMMEMKIKWRFAQPRIWRVDRSIPVAIRKRDLKNLINGYRKPE